MVCLYPLMVAHINWLRRNDHLECEKNLTISQIIFSILYMERCPECRFCRNVHSRVNHSTKEQTFKTQNISWWVNHSDFRTWSCDDENWKLFCSIVWNGIQMLLYVLRISTYYAGISFFLLQNDKSCKLNKKVFSFKSKVRDENCISISLRFDGRHIIYSYESCVRRIWNRIW